MGLEAGKGAVKGCPLFRCCRGMRLFNHFIGAREKQFRQANTQRLGGLEVDTHIKFDRLLDRQFARPGPSQYSVDISSSAYRSTPLGP